MNNQGDYQTGEKKDYFHIPVSSFKQIRACFFSIWSGITNRDRVINYFSSPKNNPSTPSQFLCYLIPASHHGKKRVKRRTGILKEKCHFLSSNTPSVFLYLGLVSLFLPHYLLQRELKQDEIK
jgi:hypothetical protein